MKNSSLDKFETEFETKLIDFEFKQIDNDDTKTFNKLKKKIKKNNDNYGCCLFNKMSFNEKIISFVEKKTNDLASFIWFEIYSGNRINLNSINDVAQVNFSYTFDKFRTLGLNTNLRLWIEKYCLENKIKYIISVPLPGSNSEKILINLGYTKKETYYIKKIF